MNRRTLCLLVAAGLMGVGSAFAAEDLEIRLASEDRAEADRARDAGRKPAEVIAFLGIETGMRVIDLIAAGGYYTEVLSLAVGSDGQVFAQNTPYVLELRDGANEKAISARLAADRLPNVERLDREVSDLGVDPETLDAAITALNFHDIYNGRGPDAALGFLEAVRAVLKPGGVLGIIDHSGGRGDDEKLHRIDEKLVIESAKQAGFEVDATSDVLRNPEDDRLTNVFDPAVRGKTDRFVLRLRKPRDAKE